MGATPWEKSAPWDPDPGKALRAIQANFVREHYNLPELIQRSLKSTQEAIQLTESEGDRFNLLPGYRQELKTLERLASQPIPKDAHDLVEIVRCIYESSGEGIGNILDVKSVSRNGGFLETRELSNEELISLVGTDKPNREAASRVFSQLAPNIERGESVCFPVYDGSGKPIGWWFAGYSID